MDPQFWQKLLILLGSIAAILFVFNISMRRLLKLEGKKFFTYDHVNKLHAIIDWTLRGLAVLFIIIGYLINSSKELFEDRIWYWEIWFIIILFGFISEAVRAFMQWRYLENKNESFFTISQLLFVSLLFITIFTTNGFGLFNR